MQRIPIRIEPLSEDAVREAIRGPLAVYNRISGTHWSVEDAFEDAVIDATRAGNIDLGPGGRGGLAEVGNQPIETAYLQITLKRLWAAERQAGSTVLTRRTFEKLGGVEGIVRAHLDEIMGGLSRAEQGVAATAFQYLVTPSGMKVPYSSWDLAKLTGRDAADIDEVLGRLASGKMRIVRPLSPSPRGDIRYEIYHDRLADPILDWRVRRERGGDRAMAVRRLSTVTALLAGGGAVASAVTQASPAFTALLAVTAALYALIGRVPQFVELIEAYEQAAGSIASAIGRRSRKATKKDT